MKLYVTILTVLLLVTIGGTVAALRKASHAVDVAQRAIAGRTTLRADTQRDLTAFERRPSETTLQPLEDDLLGRPSQLPVVDRIVTLIANRDLEPRLENALVVDLAKYDTTNAIRWLHELNVVARVNPTPEGPAIVRRTAKACWLILALRPNYGEAGIDLTRMDLRIDAAFVGQGMNLSHIDFGSAVLSPGAWHGTDVSESSFKDALVAGPLTCENCTVGGRRAAGSLHLLDGQWVPATPGKAPGRVD
jgi:hypothetical protein